MASHLEAMTLTMTREVAEALESLAAIPIFGGPEESYDRLEVARSLGVDTDGDAYLELINRFRLITVEGYLNDDAAKSMEPGGGQAELMSGARPEISREENVWLVPFTLTATAAALRGTPEIARRLDLMMTPRVWNEGEDPEVAAWTGDPARHLAKDALLTWLEKTGGTQNPFHPKNREQLLATAVREVLPAYVELWAEEAPAPVEGKQLMSSNKLARQIAEAAKWGLQDTRPISGGKSKQSALANARITWTASLNGRTVPLTGFHYDVSDAITAILLERVESQGQVRGPITAHEVARHLLQLGRRKVKDEQVTQVSQAIEDLTTTHAQIEGTDYDGASFAVRGALLHADWTLYRHRNGAVVEGWKVYTWPRLTAFASTWNQLKQVDGLLKGYKPGRLDRSTATRFIAQNLILWYADKTYKPSQPKRLAYETIAAHLGEGEISRGRARTIDGWTESYLDHLQEAGFIVSWEPYTVGRKKTGVEIYLPPLEKRPALTSRPSQALPRLEA